MNGRNGHYKGENPEQGLTSGKDLTIEPLEYILL